MKSKMISAVAVALLAVSLVTAKATVVVATNTVVYQGLVNGVPNPGYLLDITYDVTFNGSLYNYNYLLTTTPSESIYSFTVGGAPDPLNTATMAIVNYGGASVTGSGISNNSVGWLWGFNSGITSADVSFTSQIAPGTATFTLNDDDILWTSPPPIPAPVPEPSTLALLGVAAAGFGFFKNRRAVKLNS